MNKRPKLALCITRFEPGGQGVVLLEVARRLSQKFEITLYAEAASREVPAWLTFMPRQPWLHKYIPIVNREFVRELSAFDVIHCHDSAGFMDASIRSGTPTIVTAHGIYPWHMRWGLGIPSVIDGLISEIAYGSYYRRVRAVVAISPYVASWALTRYGVKTVGIPNGVDLSTFNPAQCPSSQGPVLCFAGEISKRKGVDIIVRSMPLLRQRFPSIRLRIAGHGKQPFFRWIQSFAVKNDIADAVSLIGNLTKAELASEMRSADLFVTGSRCEGFALPVVEAMACGTPAIVYDGTATRDHIVNSGAGAAFRGGPDKFAETVTRCLNGDRTNLRNKALAYSSSFDWDRIAEEYATLLHRVMDRPA